MHLCFIKFVSVINVYKPHLYRLLLPFGNCNIMTVMLRMQITGISSHGSITVKLADIFQNLSGTENVPFLIRTGHFPLNCDITLITYLLEFFYESGIMDFSLS